MAEGSEDNFEVDPVPDVVKDFYRAEISKGLNRMIDDLFGSTEEVEKTVIPERTPDGGMMEAIQMETRPKTYEVVRFPENATSEQIEELAEWMLAQDGSRIRHLLTVLNGEITSIHFTAGSKCVTLTQGEYLVWTPSGDWEVWTENQINENLRPVPHNLEVGEGSSS